MLHALPETMPVRSMRRVLPTSRSGLSVLIHDGLDWYVKWAMRIVDSTRLSRCTVWSPSSTSIRRKVQATDRERRLSVVAFRGELLSFSFFFRSDGCVSGAACFEASTKATVVEEFDTFVSSGFRFLEEPKLLGRCFYTSDHDGMHQNKSQADISLG